MRVTYFMLSVFAFVFAWLTAAYLRPVPTSSYEHAKSAPVAAVTIETKEIAAIVD